MKKSILKIANAALIVMISVVVSWNEFKTFDNGENSLFMENVEALTLQENNSGKYIAICSKKKGNVFCTSKRGKRKWAISLKISVYNSTAEINNMIHNAIAQSGYEDSNDYDTTDEV